MIQFAAQESVERYTHLKAQVDKHYPAGRFVAVDDGHLVADAETHQQLVEKLHALDKSPKGMLIVQAGIEYPQSAMIFGTAQV